METNLRDCNWRHYQTRKTDAIYENAPPKENLKEEVKKLKKEIADLKNKVKPFKYEIKDVGSGFLGEYVIFKDGKEILRSKDEEACRKLLELLEEAQNHGIKVGSN